MQKHLTALTLALTLCAACAPNFQSVRADDESSVIGGPSRDPDEREANRAALEELRDRALDEGVPVRPTPEAPPPIVVLGPERPSALTDDGALKRSAVDAFVERGPHAVLGAVVMEPARGPNGNVLGFRLLQLLDGSEFIESAGLQAGDVVRRVNGSSIVLPDQFMDVWEGLDEAEELNLEVLRDGEELSFSWPIDEAS